MAVLVHNRGADWTQEVYQAVFDKAIPDKTRPPAGLISHVAAPYGDGGLQVMDIWESEADYQRFAQEALIPAAQDLEAPAFESNVYEIFNSLIP
ncbi:hypothetical protein [Streptomyces sp. NPDC059411]|uniref:hypothetical protein n=1 Tax=Streptomyces sp. NPDC059411 TaxID=3346825 RepID=UPI0036CE804E